VPHLEQVVDAAGFRIGRIRFYTPIVGGLVENILVRIAERAMAKRAARRLAVPSPSPNSTDTDSHAVAVREARSAAKARISQRGPTYLGLRALSFVMKLDLLLFGRITSGPFFALLVKK
jgi:hypothetical protein